MWKQMRILERKKHRNGLFFPVVECLENRISPANLHTWVGGGPDNNWSTAANWDDGQQPLAGDTLVFDANSVTDSIIDPGFGNRV